MPCGGMLPAARWVSAYRVAPTGYTRLCSQLGLAHTPVAPFPHAVCTRSYGPFSVDGKPTTESNAAFDAALRQRNPQWGYRDVADVGREAAAAGLTAVERRDMPANNLLLVFRKE